MKKLKRFRYLGNHMSMVMRSRMNTLAKRVCDQGEHSSTEEYIFDILDDLSDDLEVADYLQFILINDLVSELSYKTVRFAEFYYVLKRLEHHAHIMLDIETCIVCQSTPKATIMGFRDLKVAKWLHQNGQWKSRIEDILDACTNGDLDMVEWLFGTCDVPYYAHHHIMNDTIKNGHLHIVKWLHYNGYTDWKSHPGGITAGIESDASYASKIRKWDIVKWLESLVILSL